MNIFKSEVQLQKFINWTTKVAMLIVSSPATIALAKRAYADVEGWAQLIVIGACVVLVEFSFLFFWVKLESSSRGNVAKDEQLQSGYMLGAWLMYGILLYAGILHGEGWLTFVFRASMGLLLLIASRDKLVLTKAKIEEMISNGDYQNRKLMSKRRKAEEVVQRRLLEKSKDLQLNLIRFDAEGYIAKQAEQNVLALFAKEEQMIPKTISKYKRNANMMENDFYRIEPIDDQFQVSCKMCEYHTLKGSRKAAALSGNSHQRKHSHNGHKKVKMIAIE